MSNRLPLTKNGILFVVSGPSGVGKGTLREKILKELPDLVFSVSVTTRKRRPGEIDGKDYIFINIEKFKKMIENDELLEWANVYGHYYGTPSKPIEENLKKGNSVLLEIDIQGAKKVMEKYPDVVSIFIAPPSLEELINRLKKRSTESEEEFQKRIERAEEEIREAINYDYLIINDKVNKAALHLKCIIISEKSRIIKGGNTI